MKNNSEKMYTVGNMSLLAYNFKFAVVGSRNIGPSLIEKARQIGEMCAEESYLLVSGGARGSDSETVLSCLESGGSAIEFLADSLTRRSKDPKRTKHIDSGKLLLVSPFGENSAFSVKNAYIRNDLIYAYGKNAIVIDSVENQGGTWNGFYRAVKKNIISKSFVVLDDHSNNGNKRLIEKYNSNIFDFDQSLEEQLKNGKFTKEKQITQVDTAFKLFNPQRQHST